MEVFRRLRGFYQPYVKLLVGSLIMLVVTIALGLVYPYLLKNIINKVVMQHQFGLLWPYIIMIVAAAAIRGLFNFGQQYVGQLFGLRTMYGLRNTLYQKLNRQPFRYFDNVYTGDLMSRLTADLDAFRQFLSFGFNSIVNFVLLLVFGLAVMFWTNWELSVAVIVLMPVLAFIAVRFDSKLWPAYRAVRRTLGHLNTAVQENVTGVRTVKSFAREKFEVDKFDSRNDEYYDKNITTALLWRTYFPYMELIGNMEVCIVLLLGGFLVVRHEMSLGSLVMFFSILWYITVPMQQLGFLLNNWTQSVAAGERLLEIIDANEHQLPVAANPYKAPMKGDVRFENVSLAYQEADVLHEVSFDAPAGKTIALLGMTGSGKTSIVSLIPRFYDATGGAVSVDGVDVRNWDVDTLRSHIAVVFQESFLFSTTIFANIAYGKPDATQAEVERAARLAHASEFIEALPDGYATLVGERGLGLSGGQKQRLALARAILADPTILILDDATSAVDMETEYEIQQALEEVMRGRTTFIIAHRISSLKRADLILVLDNGRVVQRGTHEELLEQKGLYRNIFDMQFQDDDSFKPQGIETAAGLEREATWGKEARCVE